MRSTLFLIFCWGEIEKWFQLEIGSSACEPLSSKHRNGKVIFKNFNDQNFHLIGTSGITTSMDSDLLSRNEMKNLAPPDDNRIVHRKMWFNWLMDFQFGARASPPIRLCCGHGSVGGEAKEERKSVWRLIMSMLSFFDRKRNTKALETEMTRH